MKINWRLIDYDLLEELTLPQCPTLFRTQAEHIIEIISRTPFEGYTKMSQYDKHLILEYWRQLDGLDSALQKPEEFKDWFLKQATNPELIRRARQWLIEHNYLIPSKSVEEFAQQAGVNWRRGVKV